MMSYLSKYGKLSSVNYDTLIVKNKRAPIDSKKVLVLDDDITVYQSNELATGFFDWSLSKDIFEHPDYYDNVTKVNNFFKEDPPDVIIDTNQLMPEFFKRIPRARPFM